MFSLLLRKLWPTGTGFAAPGRPAGVRAAGYTWHLLPDGEAVFGPAGPDLDAWVRAGRAEVVKTGPQRTIYKVKLPGGTVFAKRCRVNGPRAFFREVFRLPKARLEFRNALRLRASGIDAVEPLGWAGRHPPFPGESLFVTRCRDGAEPLQRYFDQAFPTLPAAAQPRARRTLADRLGAFVARLHDAGVAHPDPHPGNLLVEFPRPFAPRFVLIDLHAIRFGRPLSWRESLANLVLFNRWFQLRAGRADRLRFWRAYVGHRTTLPAAGPAELAAMAAAVERGTAASNARFWNGRADRYRKSNRQFRRVGAGAVHGYAVRDLPDPFLFRMLTDPDAVFALPGVRVLKDSRSSTVAAVTIPTPAGPRPAVFKRFRVKAGLTLLKNLVRPSAALRSWVFGHNLIDRGLPTPRPLAVFHRRRKGCPAEGYLLVETVPAALGLPEAVAGAARLRPGDRRRALRAWADRIGRLVRAMHDKEVAHRDLKAPNVLLEGSGPIALMPAAGADPAAAVPVLIDLVGVETGRPVPRPKRVRDLARLNASFFHSPHISRTDRLRLLRAYLVWGLHGRAGWKGWWEEIDAATRAKAAKNDRTGRPLA